MHNITHNYTILHTITQYYTQLHNITHNYTRLHNITHNYTILHTITHNYTQLHTINFNTFIQNVSLPTSKLGNIRYLIIALNSSHIRSKHQFKIIISSHFPKSKRKIKTIQLRKMNNITITNCSNELMSDISISGYKLPPFSKYLID